MDSLLTLLEARTARNHVDCPVSLVHVRPNTPGRRFRAPLLDQHLGCGDHVYGCTTCVTDAELPAMFESPFYSTVTWVDPAGSDEVPSVAWPPLSSTVPSIWVPAMKVTRPLGSTLGDVTFAVNLTASPRVEGFGEEVTGCLELTENRNLPQGRVAGN